jgi:hypothetical protein
MNKINEKVATYETHLRMAACNIENALKSICSLYGYSKLEDVRKTLYEALSMVQYNICGTFKLYDNQEIKNS